MRRASSTSRAKAVRLLVRTLALASSAPLASAPSPAAVPPFTVVHEVRVSLTTRLTLSGLAGGPQAFVEVLEGPAGRTLSLTREIPAPGGDLRVFLALTPLPDEGKEVCRLRVVSQVRRGTREAAVDRDVVLAPGRASLLDLWSAPEGGRLVLGLTASWARRPRLVPITAGAEPVQFRVQELVRDGAALELVDDRVLVGIVGTPIQETRARRPGVRADAAAPDGAAASEVEAEAGTLEFELRPEAIEDGALLVSARARLNGRPDGGDARPAPEEAAARAPSREAAAAARARPGDTFELRLGLGEKDRQLVFRITPYF